MRSHVATAVALTVAVWAASCGASIAQDLSRDDARARLSESEETLRVKREREKALEIALERLRKEREQINSRLLETAARIQESESRMTSSEARLAGLEKGEQDARRALMSSHDQIIDLLGSLQRMGRNPPPIMITRRKDALQMVRSAMLLASALPDLKTKALALRVKLDDLVAVMTDIRQEGDRHRAESKRLAELQIRLAGQMSEKKQSVSASESELAEVRRTASELALGIVNLKELLPRLDQNVEQNTELGSYNKKLAATDPPAAAPPAAAPDPGPAPTAPSVAASETSPQAVEPAPTAAPPQAPSITPETAPKTRVREPQVATLAPIESGLAGASTGRITPEIPFRDAKGKLPVPASGLQVLAFGEKTRYGGASKGIVLQTRYSAQITSPCDGWVVYAGEYRSYGQLVIINAGGGYHVLLAGLSQIDARPGEFVLAGAPVGTMRQSHNPTKRTAPKKGPVLYVEFRKDGQPINPDPWWVAGPKKVQG